MSGMLLRSVRRAEMLRDGGGLADARLLDDFVARRDEDAFAALVQRHGLMVLAVCRRVLGHEQEAEDAFQAAFLVLARKAGEIGRRDRLASWLHGVAYRTALEARSRLASRRAREAEMIDLPHKPVTSPASREVQQILDAELDRLPPEYRLPLVLCDLEGRTRRAAATECGVSTGTFAYRLTRGRQLLAERLKRRGVELGGAALASVLAEQGLAAELPRTLVNATVRSSLAFVAGEAVPRHLASLAQGVMTAMMLSKIKAIAAAMLLVAVLLIAGALTRVSFAEEPPPGKPDAPMARPKKPAEGGKTGRILLHKGLDLLSMKPDGSDAKNLAQLAAKDLQFYQPYSARISPDGKQVAFGKAVHKVGDNGAPGIYPPDAIFLRDAEQSKEGELLARIDGDELHHWVWSADGSKIALISWNKEQSNRNWIVDVKTKELKEVKLPTYKFDGKDVAMGIMDWSPDGKSFVAAGDGMHLVKIDGTDPKRLVDGEKARIGHCRFSPDGKSILYVSQAKDDDGALSLRIVPAGGGKPVTVAEGKNFERIDCCWSPDGRRIAYWVNLKDENKSGETETTLFTVDPDGQNTATVMTEKHPTHHVAFVLTAWR